MDAFAAITLAAAGVGLVAGCVQVAEYLERKRRSARVPPEQADPPQDAHSPVPAEGWPSGTVAFLFTDIEGSTALWLSQPDAMSLDLPRHDTLLREIVEAHGGRIFKTVGDACHAVFLAPEGALRAALDAQTALRHEAWNVGLLRVRMALHVCDTEARSGDYFGAGLSRVARLRDAAHGGQTLVSETAHALLENSLPDGAALHSCGPHRLKDLLRPEVIYELRHPALPEEFGPPRSLSVMPNNLPAQTTSFVGRTADVAAVQSLLRGGVRLVTLTGTGGCGKTRLALQAAAESLPAYAGGVWMADLSALSDPAGVAALVAGILDVRTDGRDAAGAVCRALQGSQLLLILDNCEHLLDAAARFADTLLRGVPGARIVATSREDLGVDGEHVFPVSPLPVPGEQGPSTLERVGRAESVRLFVDRARAGGGTFVLSDGNADAVARICRRLDGLPLAIELAGARVRTLSAEQIAGRLEDRFRLLTGGSRTAPPRQQTLRAAMDWSYDLLAGEERALFAQLSVFAGGWTLDAAEAVCTTKEKTGVLDTLSRLVDKSLVTMGEGTANSGPRFRLLETLRVYSLERGPAGGDADLRGRHRAFYAALAERAEAHLRGPEQARWLAMLDAEHDNLRAALRASDTAGRLRMGIGLHKFWLARGFLAEGRGWLEDALSAPGAASLDPALRASALWAAGVLAWAAADYGAAQQAQEAALALFRAAGDTWGAAKALVSLGIVADYREQYDAARPRYEEALALFRAQGDDRESANVLLNLGAHCVDRQLLDEADAYLRESLLWFEAHDDPSRMAIIYYDLAQIAFKREAWQKTQEELVISLRLRQKVDDVRGMADCLFLTACADAFLGNDTRAARAFGAAAALRERLRLPLHERHHEKNDAAAALLTARMGAGGFSRAQMEGRMAPPDEIIQEVIHDLNPPLPVTDPA